MWRLEFSVTHLCPLSSCSCSLSWEMIEPTASGQGPYPQVRDCIQMQPLAHGESLSPGSTGWVSSGSPTLSIQITASSSRYEGPVGAEGEGKSSV